MNLHSMKSTNITPAFKKNDRTESIKSLKGAFTNNYQHILMGYILNSNVNLEPQCTA